MKKVHPIIFFFILLFITSSSLGSSSKFFPVQNVSGNSIVEEEKLISVKRLYPNPVKDKLTVEFFVKTEGELIVKIYDILGNEIIKKNVFADHPGQNTFSFDFSDLRSGIYILKAVKGKDAVSVRIKRQ